MTLHPEKPGIADDYLRNNKTLALTLKGCRDIELQSKRSRDIDFAYIVHIVCIEIILRLSSLKCVVLHMII